MTRIGLPVPPGFTITTEVCTAYYQNGKKLPPDLMAEVQANISKLEKELGKKFSDPKNPLLVAVRSGARDSMPGMMDTILNLGLNDTTVEALKRATQNGRFAWDCYRRFVQMYGDVVMGVQKRHENEHEPFDEVMDHLKHEVGVSEDTELTEANLQELVKRYKKLIKERTGKEFPAAFATSTGFYPGVVQVFKQVAPLTRFLNEALTSGDSRTRQPDAANYLAGRSE